jgi:hypothetical protein
MLKISPSYKLVTWYRLLATSYIYIYIWLASNRSIHRANVPVSYVVCPQSEVVE